MSGRGFLQSLTKLPSDYPDKKNQAHVQVALRMQSRNQHVQAGDVIPYIMCQVGVAKALKGRGCGGVVSPDNLL